MKAAAVSFKVDSSFIIPRSHDDLFLYWCSSKCKTNKDQKSSFPKACQRHNTSRKIGKN